MFARVEEANDVAQGFADHRTEVSDDRSKSPIAHDGMTRNTNTGARRVTWKGNVVVVCHLCSNSSDRSRHSIRRKHGIVWHGVDGGGDIIVASDNGSGRGIGASATHSTVDGNDDGGTTLVDGEHEGIDSDEVVASATGPRSKTHATRSGLTTSLNKWMMMAT